MEATGLYGLDLALRLSENEKIELMVANPRAVRNFARAIMQRSKNDQLDAAILRGFAQRMEFQAWTRPAESTLALWAIARRLEALTKQSTAEEHCAEQEIHRARNETTAAGSTAAHRWGSSITAAI